MMLLTWKSSPESKGTFASLKINSSRVCLRVCVGMCICVHMYEVRGQHVKGVRDELRRLGLGTGLYSLNPGTGLSASILMLLFVARIRDGIICSPRGSLPATLENLQGFPELVKSGPPCKGSIFRMFPFMSSGELQVEKACSLARDTSGWGVAGAA